MGSRKREHVRAKDRPGSVVAFVLSRLLVAVCFLAVPRIALADARPFSLSWSAGVPPCVARPALEDAVAAKVGRDFSVPLERADVVLDGVELPAVAGRVRARLERRDREGRLLGSRELAAASCAELLESAAFVIALIVDPDALLREPPPPPAKVAPPAPPPSVPYVQAERPPAKTRGPRKPAPPLLDAGAGIAFSTGLLPGGSAAGLVMLGLRPWSLPVRFEWRGGYHLSLEAPRGREFFALAQEWRVCFLFGPPETIGASACAGVAWAAIYPGAAGLTKGDQAPKSVLAPALAVGPRFRAGPFDIVADASVSFPRPQWVFAYADVDGRLRSMHELDQIALSLSLGVARTF